MPTPDALMHTLLTTKLLRPPQRARLIVRPRLIDRLRRGQGGPLTLVTAPAGSGKTTALSAWLDAAATRSVWFSLDAEDNDPVRFWSYVCAAAERLAPGCGAAALALLHDPQPAPLAAVLASLINGLAALPEAGAGTGGRPYVLVLDDYHVIEDADIHAGLAQLIERLPPLAHLAITARADPPLPLARLRARGLVSELRAADLRFSRDEVGELLREVTGRSLSDAAVSALEARTEGWVAGLHLAALALSEQADPEGFVAAFAGSHHYIVDYLADEVLAQQPAHLRTFLLQTAILDQLCGPLCDAVMGLGEQPGGPAAPGGYSQLILAELARKNLFLIPLDGERRWFRYHQLFADVLRARLRESAPEIVPELHRRAASWYDREVAASGPGYLDAAVRHALAGGDSGRAAALIGRAADAILRQGGSAQIIRLARGLPAAALAESPELSILLARALFDASEPEAMRPLLAGAARALETADLPAAERAQLRAWALALEAQLLRVRGSYAAAIDRAQAALALLPEGASPARAFAAMGLALAMHMAGRLRDAVEPYRQALDLIEPQNEHRTVVTCCLMGLLCLHLGRWREADAAYARALEVADRRAPAPAARLPLAGWPLIGLAELAYWRDDLAEAERQLVPGIALAELGADRDALTFGYAIRTLLLQARGRAAEARESCAAFRRFAHEEFDLPLVVGLADAAAARVALMQGDRATAIGWAAGARPPEGALFRSQAFELTTYLRVLIAVGRADEALAQIAPRRARAAEAGDLLLELELELLAALANAALRQAERAQIALGRALAIAAPLDARRIFLDEGPAVAALLQAQSTRRKAQNDSLRRYCDELLRAMNGAQIAQAKGGAPALRSDALPLYRLDEPLTPREHEILRYVAEGRSNQEIAEALVVGVGTVKTHLHNLYGKLEARDRTHAVARARALGLID